MLHSLGDKILAFRAPAMSIQGFSLFMFVLYTLLMVFFFLSRRMNARAEPAEPAPRRLPQLADALIQAQVTPERSNLFLFFAKKMERQLVWLLRKADWLFYDKLKLLPDANSGRRLNFFVMLSTVCVAIIAQLWLSGDKTYNRILHDRAVTVPDAHAEVVIWRMFLYMALCVFLVALPFLLVRKNRELYLDFVFLLGLLSAALTKVIFCWSNGCCFGIPYPWGVVNDALKTTVFPVQLLEAAIYFAIVFFEILFILYAKSYRPGRGCSFFTFFFMVSRFYQENLRYRGEFYRASEAKSILGLNINTGQLICLLGCALAIAWWLLLPLEKKLMDRLRLFFVGRLRKLAANIPLFQTLDLTQDF